jgi:hypothetical protein
VPGELIRGKPNARHNRGETRAKQQFARDRSLAKRELANSCPKDVDELMEDILCSIEAIRISPEKLRGCILQSDLPSFLR